MNTGGVGAYYERLGRWNRAARAIGYGGGHATLTVHRALADPRAGGQPTYTRLHDVIVEALPSMHRPRVLDAGCGRGGTMVELATRLDAHCVGLTLSVSQAQDANAAAARAGVAARVRADVRTYDDPPAGPFDMIVAIESLAHSPCPARSVAALARVLAPGGCLAIVDDMPEPGCDHAELSAFKSGWAVPVFWRREDYLAAFERETLEVFADLDLTAACRPRTRAGLAALRAANRLVRGLMPWSAFRAVMDSHYGGLELERLLRSGRVRYRLLVARRPVVQVS
ncbi:MAG: cyclopropane-fatty-acyl-phospholipid synthase family protein [Vicinamibacterales bacterium]